MLNEVQQSNPYALPNHTAKLTNPQFQQYLLSFPRLSNFIISIQKFLAPFQPFYLETLLHSLKGRDLDYLEKKLHEEYDKLSNGKSTLQIVNNAIASREKCLEKIRRDLGRVENVLILFKQSYGDSNKLNSKQKDDNDLEGYSQVEIDTTVEESIKLISEFFTDLSRLREITIYIIETVHRWRIDIEEWMDWCHVWKKIDFIVEGKTMGVFEIIKNDLDFVWKSELGAYVWLEFECDPLVIRNVINIEERKSKSVLEKYFVEILYPKEHKIVSLTVRALDILNFTYQPKYTNLYEEEEQLAQNYSRNQNVHEGENDSKSSKIRRSALENRSQSHKESQISGSITEKKTSKNKSSLKSKKNSGGDHQNDRGWVFGKNVINPASERIREMVKKQEIEMNFMEKQKELMKSSKLPSFSDRKILALSLLSQDPTQLTSIKKEKQAERIPKIHTRKSSDKTEKKRVKSISNEKERLESLQTEASRQKLYQSLVKFNSVIEEDPKEHEQEFESPKHISTPQESEGEKMFPDKFFANRRGNALVMKTVPKNEISKTIDIKQARREQSKTVKELCKTNVRMNSFFESATESDVPLKSYEQNQQSNGEQTEEKEESEKFSEKKRLGQIENDKRELIEVDHHENALDFKRLLDVYRSEIKIKQDFKLNNVYETKINPNLSLKSIVEPRRSQSQKNIKIMRNKSIKKEEKIEVAVQREKQFQNEFPSHKKVELRSLAINEIPLMKNATQKHLIKEMPKIVLHSKQITKDTIVQYIEYLINQLPSNSELFTNYKEENFQASLIATMTDIRNSSFIFDIEESTGVKLGCAVILENKSENEKSQYQIKMINVAKLDCLGLCVRAIAEELLENSPCDELLVEFMEIKDNMLSTHFISIIDDSLGKNIGGFGRVSVYEKKVESKSSSYERIYLIIPNHKNEMKMKILNLVSNEDLSKVIKSTKFRGLIVSAKCLALTCNFKMRSEHKEVALAYKQECIGLLYCMLLQQIITKSSLKQLKNYLLSDQSLESKELKESNEPNEPKSEVSCQENTIFVRSVIEELLSILQMSELPEYLSHSIHYFDKVKNVIDYLQDKGIYDSLGFNFMKENKYMSNTEVVTCQINLEVCLDMIVQKFGEMIVLNNYNHLKMTKIVHTQSHGLNGEIIRETFGYLLPSHNSIKLIIMTGKEYMNMNMNRETSIDLYSYLGFFLRDATMQDLEECSQLVLPDITKKSVSNMAKIFKGFGKVFADREFYSATEFEVREIWENLCKSAVIGMVDSKAVVLEYPLIFGFYDSSMQTISAAFFISE